MMTLHLLSFRPDFDRLLRLAHREKLLPPGGDLGYALHAVFAASFGEGAPRPFRLFSPGERGGGPAGRLLAYSRRPLAELTAHAAAYADPAFAAPLTLEEAEEKIMPTDFPAGTRLGFEVRIRPVARTGASADGTVGARERDVYRGAAAGEAAHEARARVYADWLTRQFGRDDAARVECSEATSLGRTRLMARDRSSDARAPTAVDGPDVCFTGELVVEASAAFAGLLTRGVGRFRAFGFGMVLLRPPRH